MALKKRKPLSFSTTLRNPDRIASFLDVLAMYEGQVLTNQVIDNICCQVLIKKLYKPNGIRANVELSRIFNSDDETLSITQARQILVDNPQKHKEKGFDYGWPSRFDTWYKLIKEFGFCYYRIGSPIEISPLGIRLLEAYNSVPVDEEIIHNVFLNALSKFQTNTPFRKNLNTNVPLLLLLNVIKILRQELGESFNGIYRKEIALFLCWQDDNARELSNYIIELRRENRFSYSDEFIYEKCLELFLDENTTNINQLTNYIKISKLLSESTDEYIRKMRITGIISLRGNGRFIDWNTFETDKINYLIDNYTHFATFEDEREYYSYISAIDENLFITEVTPDTTDLKRQVISQYAEEYDDEKLATELSVLTHRNSRTDDEMLRFLDAPVRLEFLSAIALVKYFEGVTVCPNYPVDDEGLPTSTACGGHADIECFQNDNVALVEVTLMTGAANQTEHEMTSIEDHLIETAESSESFVFALFVAPILQRRALRYMNFANHETLSEYVNCGGIIAMKIDDMIEKFKSANNSLLMLLNR